MILASSSSMAIERKPWHTPRHKLNENIDVAVTRESAVSSGTKNCEPGNMMPLAKLSDPISR